ncbi:MAG TPA: hypothetical protein VEY09_17340 [Pyrinomonadaceae bacterium]|nr:hypothetical protein [Pyrinomonadaceae bacterium]
MLELDAAGTVLYSGIEIDRGSDTSSSDVTGHNFYSEVAPFLNVEEFHQLLDTFDRGGERANSFVFNCDYEDGAVPVRVLLARTSERTNGDHTRSLLVHIKKAD